MSFFTGTVAALLAGKTVNAALLFTITFGDGQIVRLWTGFGNIVLGGQVYQGAGRLISADGLDAAIGTAVPNATFKLSGVDAEIAALAIAEQNNVYGALIQVAVQVFGDGAIAAEWQPIDAPVGIGAWLGDQLSFTRQGPATRDITLTGVSLFATRSRPQGRFYTDRDQQMLYPGDLAGAYVATMVSKNIAWPLNTYA